VDAALLLIHRLVACGKGGKGKRSDKRHSTSNIIALLLHKKRLCRHRVSPMSHE
jgi:hypothetical protein